MCDVKEVTRLPYAFAGPVRIAGGPRISRQRSDSPSVGKYARYAEAKTPAARFSARAVRASPARGHVMIWEEQGRQAGVHRPSRMMVRSANSARLFHARTVRGAAIR